MTIPNGTKAPGEGKGTTLWLLKDTSTRDAAIAAPTEDALFDKLGYLIDFQGPNMTKEVTSDAYLDSTDSYLEKSGGDIDPGQIKFTVAYMPGNEVQRRIYNKFNAKGELEYGLFRSVHISGAINFYYGIISGISSPSKAEKGKLKREISVDLSGKQDLAEDIQGA
jgi:hypothetical protein